MRLLLIEDEPDFIGRMQTACDAIHGVELCLPDATGLNRLNFEENSPIEEQLSHRLRELQAREHLDLVLLDTDLSREQGALRTQTEYRQAFLSIGVPVCRYKKRHSATRLADLQFVRNLAMDGASAVWVPRDHLDDALEIRLLPWLIGISDGFAQLRQALEQHAAALESSRQGPAGLLATLLDRPSLQADLLGYTAQNVFFFADVATEDQVRLSVTATQLGYWLYNYVLAFPGPILNEVAAAAYLNVQPDSFRTGAVQTLVACAAYKGPFQQTGRYYWREELADLLDQYDGDLATAPELKDVTLKRVTTQPPGVAFYCVLSRTAIPVDEAATNPDWIPPGAQLTRIREADLDELAPMLKS